MEINTNFENYEKFNEPINKQNLISEIELVSLIPSYSHSQQQQQQQEQENNDKNCYSLIGNKVLI